MKLPDIENVADAPSQIPSLGLPPLKFGPVINATSKTRPIPEAFPLTFITSSKLVLVALVSMNVPVAPGRSRPKLVIFPVTGPVDVLVTVNVRRLLVSDVIWRLAVTPVLIPVRLHESAFADPVIVSVSNAARLSKRLRKLIPS